MDVRVGPQRRLNTEDLMLSNCSAREDLRVPYTARRSESILKEINPEHSLEGLMLKLKLQLWPPDAKGQLIRKDSDAGKD